MSVIKALRRAEDIYSRNPLPRLLRIMDRDMTTNDIFLRPGHTSLVLEQKYFSVHSSIFYIVIRGLDKHGGSRPAIFLFTVAASIDR